MPKSEWIDANTWKTFLTEREKRKTRRSDVIGKDGAYVLVRSSRRLRGFIRAFRINRAEKMHGSGVPVEVRFHRCAQQINRALKGRLDLDTLGQENSSFLAGMRDSFNIAFQNARPLRNRPYPPPYFDYFDADLNIDFALAFRDGENSFIGVTLGMIGQNSRVCGELSKDAALAESIGFIAAQEVPNDLQSALLGLLLNFIVGHEFSLHLHGHEMEELDGRNFDHFAASINPRFTAPGSKLQSQIEELGVDGYATYALLTNWFGSARVEFMRALSLGDKPTHFQDKVLISLVVVAVAVRLLRKPHDRPLTMDNVIESPYPPRFVRTRHFILEVIGWCKQNRPELAAFMTKKRFGALMGFSIAALGQDIDAYQREGAYWEGSETIEYRRVLLARIDEYRNQL